MRCSQIVRNCSRELSLEHCHSHASLVLNFKDPHKNNLFRGYFYLARLFPKNSLKRLRHLRTRPPPYRGQNPKIGKRGFQGQKVPFPSAREKRAVSQKIHISLQGSTRKMEIFGLKGPFSGALGNGSLSGLLRVQSRSRTRLRIAASIRLRKISPKFSRIKFFKIRDVPTQIPGHPGHSLSKPTEEAHLHKVFVLDIPTFGSRMSQEYPAQKLYV